MTADIETYLIIGAGQAAGKAAFAMRSAGFEGRIVMAGAEPHPPYERPPLSKAQLLDPNCHVSYIAPAEAYEAATIDLKTNLEAVSIDREAKSVRFANGSTLAYDKLLIATGSRLRKLSVPGLDTNATIYLRTLDDCRDLEHRLQDKPSLAVIGGGFIGLEVAATATQLGCNVSVIEFADRLLPRLGCPEVSKLVLEHHQRSGVDIHLSKSVDHAEPGKLILTDGTCVEADLVVAGIGVLPETSLAEEAGLDVDNGIVVDKNGRTTDPNIFAAGDVTFGVNRWAGRQMRLESWQNANIQGELAAKAMAGQNEETVEVPWVWSDQGDLNIQIAGVPMPSAQAVVRKSPDNPHAATVFQLDQGRLVAAITVDQRKDMIMARRMLAKNLSNCVPEQLADPEIPLKSFLR